jgi:hypothetical protein
VNGFIGHLYKRLGTTSNCSATDNLHISQITTAHAKPFPACCVFISRSLATTSNSGESSASRAQVFSSQTSVQNWTDLIRSKSKLCNDRRSVGQSVLMSSTHLGFTTRSLLLSDSCGFVDVGRSLWRENGSAVYNCCWSEPAQSFLGFLRPSPAGLVTIFYSQIRYSPNLEGQVPVFISPRNRVAQLYSQALGSLFIASYDSQGYGGGIRTRFQALN